MNQLLISVLLASAAVLSFGALLLVGLIAFAGLQHSSWLGWTRRLLCRLSFERLGCGDVTSKAS